MTGAAERAFSDEAARSALTALSGPYLPWGSGAMRPAGLVMVCNDIVLGDRRRVVELGSGLSTVLLARLMTQRGGGFPLVAVEHDDRWARWVRDQLAREGIGEHVVVVDAPLTVCTGAAGGLKWYDETALAAGLDRAFGADPIELLVVDGPPAYAAGHGLGRYPALPVLRPRLAAGATGRARRRRASWRAGRPAPLGVRVRPRVPPPRRGRRRRHRPRRVIPLAPGSRPFHERPEGGPERDTARMQTQLSSRRSTSTVRVPSGPVVSVTSAHTP